MTVENWTMYFANLLKRQWREWGMGGDPPFAAAKGDEAITYCNLPTQERCARSHHLWAQMLQLFSQIYFCRFRCGELQH
jgi:hypothetical protein